MKQGLWNEKNQEQPYTMTYDEIIQNPDYTKEPIDFKVDQKPYLKNSEGYCLKLYTWTFKEIEQWSNEATRPEQVANPLRADLDTRHQSLGAIRRAKEAAALAAQVQAQQAQAVS